MASWLMSFFPFSFAFSNSLMVFLQRCRLSEADWSQCRLIYSGGVGDLQHQFLVRLLNRRAFKNDDAVNSPIWNESSLADLVILYRQLMNSRPASMPENAGFRLSTQLHLRWHQLRRLGSRTDDRK